MPAVTYCLLIAWRNFPFISSDYSRNCASCVYERRLIFTCDEWADTHFPPVYTLHAYSDSDPGVCRPF